MKTLPLLLASLLAATSAVFGAAPSSATVTINLGPTLLNFASRCAASQDPETAELLRGLKSVQLRVYENLNSADAEATMALLREQSTVVVDGQWETIMQVNQPDETTVQAHVKFASPEVLEGIVLTVAEKNQRGVLIEVVGTIPADKVDAILKHCNLPTAKALPPVHLHQET